MPGVASLEAAQYYAHPRNQFWNIMDRICGAGRQMPYEQRLERLRDHQLALWDVLYSCLRQGSLDGAIEQQSAQANDLIGLLRRAPYLRRICCNGGTAHRAVRRYFEAQLRDEFPQLEIHRLPSTSPANAGCSAARKLTAWTGALDIIAHP
jgi:TDG/mug DNA glycosylase family protein